VVSSSASYTFTANANRSLVANFNSSVPANPGVFKWASQIGGAGYSDGAIPADSAVDHRINPATQQPYGDVVVVGYFEGTVKNVNTGGNSTTSSGPNDVYLAKYSASGSLSWFKKIGGVGSDLGSSVAIDSTGDIVVVGTCSVDVNFGNGNTTSQSLNDGFLAKYSPDGQTLRWVQRFTPITQANHAVYIDRVAVD